MARPTKEAIAYHHLGQTLRELEVDLRWGLKDSVRIPAAWHDIALTRTVPAKEKMTLKLDEDVVMFFREFGRGYTGTMNLVLRSFMLARLAEVIRAVPAYGPSPYEEEQQIKAELFSLLESREAAREAAIIKMRDGPKERANLAAAKEIRSHYIPREE